MKIVALLLSFALFLGMAVETAFAGPQTAQKETVVLLHGLTRTKSSMAYLKYRLSRDGYDVVDLSYPSREMAPEDLIAFVDQHLVEIGLNEVDQVHFVTHSLGGLIVRGLAQRGWDDRIGRVVMLGPPNRGSELVDAFGEEKIFGLAYGVTGQALGTDEDSFPSLLGDVRFELGVIAGNRSINPVGSYVLPGLDDGVVSVGGTQLEGMTDFIVLPVNHTTLTLNPVVADQTVSFLKSGSFHRHESNRPVNRFPSSL